MADRNPQVTVIKVVIEHFHRRVQIHSTNHLIPDRMIYYRRGRYRSNIRIKPLNISRRTETEIQVDVTTIPQLAETEARR